MPCTLGRSSASSRHVRTRSERGAQLLPPARAFPHDVPILGSVMKRITTIIATQGTAPSPERSSSTTSTVSPHQVQVAHQVVHQQQAHQEQQQQLQQHADTQPGQGPTPALAEPSGLWRVEYSDADSSAKPMAEDKSLTWAATEGPALDYIPRYPAPEGDDPDSHAHAHGHPLSHVHVHTALGRGADTHASAPGQQLGGGQGATFLQLRERALEGSSTEEEGEWQTMDVPALLYTWHHASALDSLSSCDVDNPADLQQQQEQQQQQQHEQQQLGQDRRYSAAEAGSRSSNEEDRSVQLRRHPAATPLYGSTDAAAALAVGGGSASAELHVLRPHHDEDVLRAQHHVTGSSGKST